MQPIHIQYVVDLLKNHFEHRHSIDAIFITIRIQSNLIGIYFVDKHLIQMFILYYPDIVLERLLNRIPTIGDLDRGEIICKLESYTPDGYPLVGESSQVIVV
jgi:hypothetical protein